MQVPNDATEFLPALLSVREREVVDLAVLGHTDEQISQMLDITTSTVNSYWGRIRGKLGQYSRTEIVAKMLHAGYHEEHARQEVEIARLTGLLATADANLAGARRQIAEGKGVDWYLLALHYASEALLIADAAGKIVYANLQAEKLFGAEPAGLLGTEVCELTRLEEREVRRSRILEFLSAGGPARLALGIQEPCFAHDLDGGRLRISMVLERFQSESGPMAVVTVKKLLADVEEFVRSLRQPIAIE